MVTKFHMMNRNFTILRFLSSLIWHLHRELYRAASNWSRIGSSRGGEDVACGRRLKQSTASA